MKNFASLTAAAHPHDDLLVDALIDVSFILARMLAESLEARSSEITLGQYEALLVLARCGPTRPLDFTELLGIDPSTTTRLCDRLVRRGFIVRERPEFNRREVTIALSAPGRSLIEDIANDRRARFGALVEEIPISRRSSLLSGVEMLLKRTARAT